MAKKIFFFSLSLLVLVLILIGAYSLAFKNNKNDPVADSTKKEKTLETSEKPLIPQDSVEKIINEALLGAVAGDDDHLYYYSLDQQALKKSTLDGKDKVVLMSNLPGEATRVLWSEKKDKVLLQLKQSGGGTLWYYAHLGNKSLIPLKPEISRLVWDNLGEKVFYVYTDPSTGKRSLNSAAPDGSDWKKLTDLGSADFFLSSVPQSSLVSFWIRPEAGTASSLETVGTVGETRRTLTSGLYGADFLWSPTGESVLVSANDAPGGKGLSLRTVGNDGKMKNLALPTLISKTAWSKDGRNVYYAFPGGLPDDAVLPNDYFGKSLHSKDTFWKINTTTGKPNRILELKETTEPIDATDLFLSPKEDALYFTDRVTKNLYRIEF